MPANGAVYIPQAKIDLADIFAGATSDKGLFRNASYYGVKLGTDVVRYNIMPPAAGIQMASSGLMPALSSLIPKFHFSIEAAFGTTTHELQIVTPSEIRAVPASKRAFPLVP